MEDDIDETLLANLKQKNEESLVFLELQTIKLLIEKTMQGRCNIEHKGERLLITLMFPEGKTY
jgi:hypothetical protein